jgi:hypothetical protein
MDVDELVLGEVDGVGGDPNETELERWQRNFAELLQELRVMQTGVQILFAFLLSLAASGRFDHIDAFLRTVYVVDLLAAAAATGLIVAPVAHHRTLFRRRRKAYLVRSAHRMAAGGLWCMVVAMVSSVLLATDLVLTRPAAVVLAGVTACWFGYFWGVSPWVERRRTDPPGDLGTVRP